MSKRAWIGLAAALLSACGKKDPETGGGTTGPAATLKSIKPATGGEMLLLPAGEFTMGEEGGRPSETPHAVMLSAFYIDRHPVTQEIYEKAMGANPSKKKGPKNPVEQISWTDAVRFLNKCSEMEGLTPAYDLETWTCDFEADGYRLPTEAEWEYACRAGSTTRYTSGDAESELAGYSWSKPQSRGKAHPVGTKKPNAWGLYDVHGNVWEWCNDWYDENYYKNSPKENPRGPEEGKKRVLRGGGYMSPPNRCRSAYRLGEFPAYVDACFGVDAYGIRRARNGAPSGTAKAPPKKPAPEVKPEVPPTPAPSLVQSTGKIDAARLKGTIIFVSDRGGHLDIWKMHATGRDPKALTNDENPDADPRFSPDGTKILYTTLREGFPQVWIMNRDGSGAKKVCEGAQATWSPDGKSIVLIRDDQAWTRVLASGREKRITPEKWERCGTPAWSPDGKRVAVASRHEGTIQIYVLGADGTGSRKVVTDDACCTPSWSGDGKRILFQTVKGHIHEVPVDGGADEQLTFGADVQHEARYSPDGSLAAFCRAPTPQGPWQICILDLDSDDLDFIQLTKEGSNSLPDWHAKED